MKLLTWLFCCFLFPLLLQAQTQEGFVKTIGRPNRPGKPLSGVTIRMRGQTNTVISNKHGQFSVILKDKQEGDAIVLQHIQKKGYELKDKDLIGRQIVFSSRVPIEIVMVNLKELAEDKRRIEKNAYHKAEENYRDCLAQLEKRFKEKELTELQYKLQHQELQKKYEKYQALIGDMADRYARTDYDRLDSIDKTIYFCIENGELEKADSLIHTVFDPNTVLERNRAAKAEVKAKMELAQQIIDKATSDLEAIKRDREYALRVAILSENLAQEYMAEGNKTQAIACLKKSQEIKTLLYGGQNREVVKVRMKIRELEGTEP